MFKHKQGSHAPVRGSVRVVFATGLLVGALMVLSVAPARAAPEDCGDAVLRLAQWTTHEARRGLTTGMLEDLRELSGLLAECAGSGFAGSDVEDWRPLVGIYFEPDEIDRVLCLMTAESGGDPDARNAESDAAGLMQVMPFWTDVFDYSYDDLFRPEVNLWVASQILDKQGWTAWSPYQRGLCH